MTSLFLNFKNSRQFIVYQFVRFLLVNKDLNTLPFPNPLLVSVEISQRKDVWNLKKIFKTHISNFKMTVLKFGKLFVLNLYHCRRSVTG